MASFYVFERKAGKVKYSDTKNEVTGGKSN